jgi:hypothetical protein
MLVKFDSLDDSSKVWIYQSNRMFSKNEEEKVVAQIEKFITNWQAHGQDLKASYKIKYHQFIIIAVDESFNEVSGCSIDASVKLILNLEQHLNLDLTNKLNISFKDHDNINVISLLDFKNYVKQKKITENTIVFNNLIATKADFKMQWEIAAGNSWHKRFFVQ